MVYICTTPEPTHFPIRRDCLRNGKHVLLEKPIAMELWEADELITLAKRDGLKFTIGYSQRFNTKIAYAKKKIADGTLGKAVSVMVSRHLSRSLGKKIASRVRLSPVVMESTHDLDFRVLAARARQAGAGLFAGRLWLHAADQRLLRRDVDHRHHGQRRGGDDRRRLEFAAELSELLRHLDRDHRHRRRAGARRHPARQLAQYRERGQEFPMSTMPGEQVDHVFAGGMGPETIHFLEACILDPPVMVTPESARRVMETYTAADLSAERNEPVDLPLTNETIAAVADFKAKIRAGDNK